MVQQFGTTKEKRDKQMPLAWWNQKTPAKEQEWERERETMEQWQMSIMFQDGRTKCVHFAMNQIETIFSNYHQTWNFSAKKFLYENVKKNCQIIFTFIIFTPERKKK